MKKIWGCEEEVEPYYIDDIKVNRCPLKLITPKSHICLKLYSDMKLTGHLFEAGNLSCQSGKLIEIMNIIEKTINRKAKANNGKRT